MTNINELITQLVAMFGNIETLITAAVSVIVTAIAAYKLIIEKWNARKTLESIVSPIAAEAENKPMSVLNSIINKPFELDGTAHAVAQSTINSNEGKSLIVAAKAFETAKAEKPKVLKKLGINSVTDMIPLVNTIYQDIVKPIIKRH